MPVLKVDIQHHGIKPDVHSENIRNQNSTIEETQFAFSVSVPLSWLFKFWGVTTVYRNSRLMMMRGF